MKKLIASFVLVATLLTAVTSNAACLADDLPCFKRGFLERGQQIDSLKRELELSQVLRKADMERYDALNASNTALKGALDATKPALKAAERSIIDDPRLWFGVGIVVGMGVVLLGAFSLSQVSTR